MTKQDEPFDREKEDGYVVLMNEESDRIIDIDSKVNDFQSKLLREKSKFGCVLQFECSIFSLYIQPHLFERVPQALRRLKDVIDIVPHSKRRIF